MRRISLLLELEKFSKCLGFYFLSKLIDKVVALLIRRVGGV